MEEDEWVDAFQGASVADLDWYRHQSQNGSDPAASSWTPRNLADLEDKPPVQPSLGGLGMVYPGKRHVFSGPQESAKTLAAYVIGLQVVRSGGRTVLIDFEMGPWDAKARLRELGASDDELGRFLYVEPDTPISAGAIGELVGLEPSLVLVDAAAGAFQLEALDDNARKDVEKWAGAWIAPFWRAGVATIVLDHVVKNSELRGAYAIGSERKVGGVDVHLGFSVVRPIRRGESGTYKVTTHKDRGGVLKRGHLVDFKLTSDPDTHLLSWEFVAPAVVDDEHPFRPTALMEKVSRFLEMQTEPVSRNTVEKASLGRGEYVRLALDLLTSEGFVEETHGAKRARLVELVRAYREASDNLSHDFVPSSSQFVPESEESSSSVRPTPYRGDELRTDLRDGDELTSSQGVLDDGIPF